MAPFSPREREQREKKQLQAVRDTFFKGADSGQVSDDRAFRRLTQDRAEQNFKDRFTKGVEGSSNLLQMTQDAPRSLTAERERLANIYGPTPRELAGDFARGLGSIVGGVSDRVMSGNFGLLGIAKDLYNKASGALKSGVDKLSNVDLEILKNKDKYNFVSNKPKLQGITQLENDAKLAANVERNAGIIAANRNLFGDYSEFGGPALPGEVDVQPMSSLLPQTQYEMPQRPPGFKVASPEQREFLKEIREADKMYDGIISSKQPTNVVKEGQPIRIQNKIATPITEEEFSQVEKRSDAMFNEPFFQQ